MRSRCVLLSVALVTALSATNSASGGTGCSTKVIPPTKYTSTEQSQATSAPLLKVTDAHTSAKPLVVRYTHRLGATAYHFVDVQRELINRRVQIITKKPHRGLWLRATFRADPVTDIDLYVHDAHGSMIGYSEADNGPLAPVGDLLFYEAETGGPGFENINGLPVRHCATVLTETQNSQVLQDAAVTLKLWLGPVGKGGH